MSNNRLFKRKTINKNSNFQSFKISLNSIENSNTKLNNIARKTLYKFKNNSCSVNDMQKTNYNKKFIIKNTNNKYYSKRDMLYNITKKQSCYKNKFNHSENNLIKKNDSFIVYKLNETKNKFYISKELDRTNKKLKNINSMIGFRNNSKLTNVVKFINCTKFIIDYIKNYINNYNNLLSKNNDNVVIFTTIKKISYNNNNNYFSVKCVYDKKSEDINIALSLRYSQKYLIVRDKINVSYIIDEYKDYNDNILLLTKLKAKTESVINKYKIIDDKLIINNNESNISSNIITNNSIINIEDFNNCSKNDSSISNSKDNISFIIRTKKR